MRWRRRVCRTAKWLSATAAALLVAAWLASMVGWFQWAPTSGWVGTSSSYLICNSRGSLVLDWLRPYKHSTEMVWIPHDMGGGLRFGGYIETKPLQSEWRWRPRLIRKEGFRRALLIVPIWIPLTLAALAWIVLQWRDLWYSYRGWCYRCDYDCRNLPVASPCPECGRARLVRKSAGG